MKKVLILSLPVFALALIVMSGTVFADSKCKDVKLKIKNNYKDGANAVKIKVLAVNYYDTTDKKWRDNDIKNTEIANGSTKTVTEDLEYVENETVEKFQIKFKFDEDKGWSTDKWSTVMKNKKKCVKGQTYNMTISGTGSKQ